MNLRGTVCPPTAALACVVLLNKSVSGISLIPQGIWCLKMQLAAGRIYCTLPAFAESLLRWKVDICINPRKAFQHSGRSYFWWRRCWHGEGHKQFALPGIKLRPLHRSSSWSGSTECVLAWCCVGMHQIRAEILVLVQSNLGDSPIPAGGRSRLPPEISSYHHFFIPVSGLFW